MSLSPTSPTSPSVLTNHPFTRARFIIRRLQRLRAKSLNDDLCGSYGSVYSPEIYNPEIYSPEIYSPEPRSLPPLSTASFNTIPDAVEDELFECCSHLEEPVQCLESLTETNSDVVSSVTSPISEVAEETIVMETEPMGVEELFEDLEQGLKRLEDMLQMISASTLLEEIEDSLPATYSLRRRPYGQHTLFWYRVLQRLSRLRIHKHLASAYDMKEAIPPRQTMEDEIKRLRDELFVRRVTFEQSLKARRYSTMSSSPFAGDEYLEVEKAVLTSKMRQEAVESELSHLQKLKRLDLQPEPKTWKVSIGKICGRVNDSGAWSPYKLICIAVGGESIWESNIEQVSRYGEILFEFKPQASLLRSNFTIFIYLYGIRAKDSGTLQRSKSAKSLALDGHNFTLLDTTSIQHTQWRFSTLNLPLCCRKLCDTFKVDLVVDINERLLYEGFLSLRKQTTVKGTLRETTVWQRGWYRLQCHVLQGWSCPTQKDKTNPDYIISLENHLLTPVSPTEDFSCMRPFAFSFSYTTGDGAVSFVFCAAESKQEMIQWCHLINDAFKYSQF